MLNAWLRIILCRGLRDGNMSKRPIGRPKTRWEDVLEDTKNMDRRTYETKFPTQVSFLFFHFLSVASITFPLTLKAFLLLT
jgi:hypothetical protein